MATIKNLLKVVGKDAVDIVSKVVTSALYPILGNLPAGVRRGLESLLPDFNSMDASKVTLVTNVIAYCLGTGGLGYHMESIYSSGPTNCDPTILVSGTLGFVLGLVEGAIRDTRDKNGETYGNLIGEVVSLPIALPVQYARSVYRRAKKEEKSSD